MNLFLTAARLSPKETHRIFLKNEAPSRRTRSASLGLGLGLGPPRYRTTESECTGASSSSLSLLGYRDACQPVAGETQSPPSKDQKKSCTRMGVQYVAEIPSKVRTSASDCTV